MTMSGAVAEARTEFPGVSRGDPVAVDTLLRRLANRESACRLALGRLAARFLAVRGQHTLGFARLGDYTRERLGISAREVQSHARVAVALQRLPELAAAFASGGISWSHVRLLVPVATPESAGGWVALARRYTVRGLEMLVGRQRRPALADDDEATIDGEPRVIFRLRCPRHVRVQWRELVELGRRMSGAPVRMWQAAECVAAEALSGTEVLPDGVPSSPPPLPRGREPLLRAPADDGHPPDLGGLPHHQTRDPFSLDERMRLVMAAMQRIDCETGRLLQLLLQQGSYRRLGFNSLAHYARERLGMSERKARALMVLARRTDTLRPLGDAYQRGDLSWLRALTLLPVAAAPVAQAWVDRARAVTLRRLVDEVQWALDAKDLSAGMSAVAPPPLGAALATPRRQMCAQAATAPVDAQVTFAAPASVVGLLHQAMAALAQHGDPPWRAFERILAHARAEWRRSARHPDPVFARDGWRCTVPACSSRRTLHDHHLLFRSRGGSNARDNRIAVCAWHHLRGIHGGRIRAHGHAPHHVTWELGLRRGHPALLRLVGDRYAVSS